MASSEPVSEGRGSQKPGNGARPRCSRRAAITADLLVPQVHPLRISKQGTPASSPNKMASSIPRPLSEVSPHGEEAELAQLEPGYQGESPAFLCLPRLHWPVANGVIQKLALNTDSSPFQSSPIDATTSPRLFWQNRNGKAENGGGPPSPTRRSSIERLQRASRVKNSNILALEQRLEYDPTKVPVLERPLAKVQGNAYGGTGIAGLRAKAEGRGHHRSESQTNIPLYSPTKSPTKTPRLAPSFNPQWTYSKDQASPTKSSLSSSRFKSSYDKDHGDLSADTSLEERELPSGKSLHRHAKSVTFDAAPPQVNEYEMATPDLSSIGTNSRDGSYESEEDDYEFQDHYAGGDAPGQDDSFDASLEDTDKTPVVGPDDWRHDSPAAQHGSRGDDVFEGSPLPDSVAPTTRPQHSRTDSANSNGDHRPLPPLPGGHKRSGSASSTGLSATAERMMGTQRSLPSPPPASTTKTEIQNIGNGKMTLEERLKLMMLSDDGKTAAGQQRERRMRRAGARERTGSQTPEPEAHSSGTRDEDEDTVGELSGLEEYQLPPRISRESILRRVNGNTVNDRESDYNFSSPAPSSSPERRLPLDCDIPIPSTEQDSILEDDAGPIEEEVEEDEEEEEKEVDAYDIPDLYRGDGTEDEDSGSQYSGDNKPKPESGDGAGIVTPRAGTPVHEGQFVDVADDANRLQPFPLPKPAEADGPKMGEAHDSLQRPFTPDKPMSKPEYDGSGWGDDDEFEEPGTPDSVIHHPVVDDESPPRDSPAVPERFATIKASGSKLKTRPSATPSDLMAMREARRQVSREIPAIPPIPERHRNRISRDFDAEQGVPTGDDFLERHPSFKKRSLTLDLDVGLSMDQDFERVIEAQKVAFQNFPPSSFKAPVTPTPIRQASKDRKESAVISKADGTSTNISSRNQRGYLMRQNTKLVAASDKDGDDGRGTRSAGNSPVKKDRPQSWTVEPWNGQVRRKSVRKRTAMAGPVPPLPGQESNAVALNPLTEEDLAAELATEEGGERGRLFVKVMGVKDLDLPVPKSESQPEPCVLLTQTC